MDILKNFHDLKLTKDQYNALKKIQLFLSSDDPVFILKGFAGSGKTTLLKGIVNYLDELGSQYHLMAPTGRAAKVINQKTGINSTTVHKGIYSFEELVETNTNDEDENLSFKYYYKIWNNPEASNTIFLVDESSMLSDHKSEGEFFQFGSGHLLTDLITYTRVGTGHSKSKIIFVGDPAQLPPVGMNFSPALNEKYLFEKFSLKSQSAELKEIKRQQDSNGILSASFKIRKCLTSGYFNDFDLRANEKDIFNLEFEDFINTYERQEGKKVIVTYKNKTAVDLNSLIRRNKYGTDLQIQSGDIVIIGSNNYKLRIMNGEFGIVAAVEKSIISREIRFYSKETGKLSTEFLQWRGIEILFPDQNNSNKTVKGYMLESFLHGDNFLKPSEQQALYIDFKNRHPDLKEKSREFKEVIANDPYFNPILLKYGYAVTCHKAQGGEWNNAFVFWDKGVKEDYNIYKSEHNRSGKSNPDFYRWAYTAITRASEKLFCINPPCFNSFSGMSFTESKVQDAWRALTTNDLKPAEIELKGDYLAQLKNHELIDLPLQLQDHFIKIYYRVNKKYIDIEKWEKIQYEIRYYFSREGQKACMKFWINGKNEFKDKFMDHPPGTNSDSLLKEVTELLDEPVSLVVNRNTAGTIIPKIEFELDIEEEKPFLKNLADALYDELENYGIKIFDINHQNYRERYTFRRASEVAVIDFEYNSDGFFGRVVPIESKCNSERMLFEIKDAVNSIKN